MRSAIVMKYSVFTICMYTVSPDKPGLSYTVLLINVFLFGVTPLYLHTQTQVNVYKDPVTDHGKMSRKGRMTLELDSSGQYITRTEGTGDPLKARIHKYTYTDVSHYIEVSLILGSPMMSVDSMPVGCMSPMAVMYFKPYLPPGPACDCV